MASRSKSSEVSDDITTKYKYNSGRVLRSTSKRKNDDQHNVETHKKLPFTKGKRQKGEKTDAVFTDSDSSASTLTPKKEKTADLEEADTLTKLHQESDGTKNVIKTEVAPCHDPVYHASNKYVGAHVSVVGGLENAVLNAIEIGAKSFGLFLRSQRQWNSKPLSEESAIKFRDTVKEYGFLPHLILPHGSYLLNCGSPKEDVLEKSRAALIDELKRCEMLGLSLYNFHPGSTCGIITVEECIDRIAESINLAHKETKYVIAVIENMSCQGNTIGGKFKELRAIIDKVTDKSRIGVCLDTCHAFAAGYDLSKQEGFSEMMDDFESHIGLKYLRALHLNDSKGKVGCHLDRHENIGKGNIGLDGFRRIMNDPRFNNIPLILETPPQLDDKKEINILYKMCK